MKISQAYEPVKNESYYLITNLPKTDISLIGG